MKRTRAKKDLAMSLIEVVIAIGLLIFAIVPLLALLPIGLNSVKVSSDEAMAVNFLSELVADIRATPPTGSTSLRFAVPLDEVGTKTFDVNEYGEIETDPAEKRYSVRCETLVVNSFSQPLIMRLRIGWPATAVQQTDSVETVIAARR